LQKSIFGIYNNHNLCTVKHPQKNLNTEKIHKFLLFMRASFKAIEVKVRQKYELAKSIIMKLMAIQAVISWPRPAGPETGTVLSQPALRFL
jgi:hypothetical protein